MGGAAAWCVAHRGGPGGVLVKLKFQERLVRERQERERQAEVDRLAQLEKKRVEKETRKRVKMEKKEKKAREARMMKTGQVRVPEDCSTLKEAVNTVNGYEH